MDNVGVVTTADGRHLPVTTSLIDETLRSGSLRVQFPRDAVKDDELVGHRIPAGSTVMISAFAAHRNPDIWEDAHTLNRQRFRDGSEKSRSKFAYLPFGDGRRQCIGKPLALPGLSVAVAMTCQGYRAWALAGKGAIGRQGFITIFPPTLPGGGLTIGLTLRQSS